MFKISLLCLNFIKNIFSKISYLFFTIMSKFYWFNSNFTNLLLILSFMIWIEIKFLSKKLKIEKKLKKSEKIKNLQITVIINNSDNNQLKIF